MEVFLNLSVETLYLYALIISGVLIILLFFFGDVLGGIEEASPFLNPILILAFIVFLSASGYLFEVLTSLNSIPIALISVIIAFIFSVLLNVFILVPMSSAEESLVYSEDSLRGRVGVIIIPIPEKGYGEVLIESYSGRISKTAESLNGQAIANGEKVLVIEVKESRVIVTTHEQI
ncbi:hypothetical protein LG276_08900 [Cytobacillus kochii]|uniref:NfeD family protein n=1 Tax=Cytobacillus kochii TaxID=859143 RepID=UPI001CD257A7|nr:hypothetical protein [Cytobacillus kochii]MCA1027532.1 hypothetical protein [Cytobacillus kochii]MDM5207040.1 hypothetical protein [Cytobacillus kochii]